MVERHYHIKDIIGFWGLNPRGEGAREIKAQICPNRRKGDKSKPLCYTDEFQAWFTSGIRVCERHAYPYVWHVITGLECRKCAGAASRPLFDIGIGQRLECRNEQETEASADR